MNTNAQRCNTEALARNQETSNSVVQVAADCITAPMDDAATAEYFSQLGLRLQCTVDFHPWREERWDLVDGPFGHGRLYWLNGQSCAPSLDGLWTLWGRMQPVLRSHEACVQQVAHCYIQEDVDLQERVDLWLAANANPIDASVMSGREISMDEWPWSGLLAEHPDLPLKLVGWPWDGVSQFCGAMEMSPEWVSEAKYFANFDPARPARYLDAIRNCIVEASRTHLSSSLRSGEVLLERSATRL